jgi:large subunit ribosomal protein L10
MSRLIKEKIVEQYQAAFQGVGEVAVIDAQGVNVEDMTALRASLRTKGLRAKRLQNRLGKLALEAAGLKGIGALLHGPSTLVWGGDGIVTLARTLTDEAKTLPALGIRGGYADGQVLSKDDFEALSKLPSREQLIGMVIGRATGQAARVAALATAPGGGLVAQIREIEKKAGGGEEAPAEA